MKEGECFIATKLEEEVPYHLRVHDATAFLHEAWSKALIPKEITEAIKAAADIEEAREIALEWHNSLTKAVDAIEGLGEPY